VKKPNPVPVNGTDEDLRDAIISTLVSVRDELRADILDLADELEPKDYYLYTVRLTTAVNEHRVHGSVKVGIPLESRDGRKRSRRLSKETGGLVRNKNWPKNLTRDSRLIIRHEYGPAFQMKRRVVFLGTLEACQVFLRDLKQV
jgi:hypothetical protein